MVPHGSVNVIAAFILPILISYEIVEESIAAQFYNIFDEKNYMYFKEVRSKSSQIFDGAVYEDGIVHVEINELNPAFYQIKTIENAFNNILGMNGVKYIFKRNFYWRTWREVKDNEGESKLVCFRCQTVFNVTCLSCNCGYWEIEENPPCPFEIFSIINSTHMCGTYYHQLKNLRCKCPSIISFRDLGKCDNPLETTWRITRLHDSMNVSRQNVNVICQARENCYFSTVYSIFPDRITFRIINSFNKIIYSKVMKNGHRNYACLGFCGVFNSTFKQIVSDRKTSTFLNLEQTTVKRNKKKRTTILELTSKKPIIVHRSTQSSPFFTKITTKATCKHLQVTHSDEDYVESEYSD